MEPIEGTICRYIQYNRSITKPSIPKGKTSISWSERLLKASSRSSSKVTTVQQLTLEVPDPLAQQLARLAAEQQKTVEQVALEKLASVLATFEEDLEERYERFFQESGLFVEGSTEEANQNPPVSEERLRELATKLGKAGPLSEVILEERGRR
jgi:hypothetical protein